MAMDEIEPVKIGLVVLLVVGVIVGVSLMSKPPTEVETVPEVQESEVVPEESTETEAVFPEEDKPEPIPLTINTSGMTAEEFIDACTEKILTDAFQPGQDMPTGATDQCYQQAAIHYNDKSLCEKLTGPADARGRSPIVMCKLLVDEMGQG